MTMTATHTPEQRFLAALRGSFTSALRWHHLDALWERIQQQAGDGEWYIYAIGQAPPTAASSQADLGRFITEADRLLREEHAEDYCGIVYADDLQTPTLVKIYDPNNLGVSCGYSDSPPLPGWILSKIPPCDLQTHQGVPRNRKRWWRQLFGG